MIESAFFYLVAVVLLVSSVLVVRSQDLVRAVLWLAVSLVTTAALYALLGAPFLAGVQVLTYVGGVVTLMIFGVMVTRRHDGTPATADRSDSDRGAVAALGVFALLALAIWKSDLAAPQGLAPATTASIARALLDDHLLAFEAASLLLLAAIVGAVVLARRGDPDPATGKERGPREVLRDRLQDLARPEGTP